MHRRPVTIRLTRRFPEAPARLFDAWLDPATAAQWMFATATRPATMVHLDARAGGAFRFAEPFFDSVIEHRGEYLEIARPRRLVFSLWEGESRVVSRVEIDIVATPTAAAVTLTHSGVPQERAPHVRTRWIGMLYGLGEVLASQTRPRVSRPRFRDAHTELRRVA